jgi:asparagine synthase (glutamine-hydrolysing)
MCGIVGFWGQRANLDRRECLERMTATLIHRGPDAGGAWLAGADEPALGHRRLSVVDVSEGGSQPMQSRSGRFVISYNGEVYDFEVLREELRARGYSEYRGHSDTEVILNAVEAWGIERALERFNGMLAFAIWDRQERQLHLASDRMGKKPLYYGWVKGTFLFASELKALVPHPAFDDSIDRGALELFFRFGFIPAPASIYRSIRKLEGGRLLSLRSPDRRESAETQYWSLERVFQEGREAPYPGTDAEAIEELRRLLLDAVRVRKVADVPLGSLLSGGIDSSLVTALMQAQSTRPVRTFSVGSSDPHYDESVDARRVAAHLGTEHTELTVSAQDALGVIPSLPLQYDEPFADASQIPTYLISKLARQHITVALTGDGGDEIWGGYDRYIWGRAVYRGFSGLPVWLRQLCARALGSASPDAYDHWLSRLGKSLPARYQVRLPGDKIHKLSRLARTTTPEEFHLALASLAWSNPQSLLRPPHAPTTLRWPASMSGTDIAELMMQRDLAVAFPGDMLTKVDRASMAASLECRLPLADHRVLEFASRLPLRLKIHAGQGKVALRRVLDAYVPRQLVDRPKMGFGVPLGQWLRGPLLEWADDLLSEVSLSEGGLLEPAPIRTAWREHQSGAHSRHVELWAVLMFQAWRRQMPWSLADDSPSRLQPARNARMDVGAR